MSGAHSKRGGSGGRGAPGVTTTNAYGDLISRVKDAALLTSSADLLSWDQQTMMPQGGIEHRSLQLAQLAGLAHERTTDPRVGELLAECESDGQLTADPSSEDAANLREIRRTYDRATKLPGSLVEEIARSCSMAEHDWAKAREKSDFSLFLPFLERNVTLLRRAAECLGWSEGGEPWDALAEEYEPGMNARAVEAVFTPLRDDLQTLVSDLMTGPRKPSTALKGISVPIEAQSVFVRRVAEAMGFDFSRGRLDTTVHPFCSGSHPGDIRITTRFAENKFFDALGSTMHEAGHGLYEQGLPVEHNGTPLGRAVSLGIHESQSRMWENFVGRSRSFWQWCLPEVKRAVGAPASHLSVEDAFEGMNAVRPDLIRVEADEATYNLHIMVRFELERALVSGDLQPADVPHEWNRRYKEYLGVDVPDDAHGCLQDVHWSAGLIGYFPTYTLGNLYSAQLFEKARQDVPDLESSFTNGEFSPLKAWLNENVHAHGGRYLPADLCERVTGKPLEAEPLLRHLNGKLRPLYGV